MDLRAISSLHPDTTESEGLLWLELDHGKANEIGEAEIAALEALCSLIEQTPAVRSLCISSRRMSSSGKPIFVAGANVTQRIGWDDARVKHHVRRQRAVMQSLRHLPVYTTVITHGVTLGWGVELLLTADWVIATPTATFALPETGLGILPGAGGTANLAEVVGIAEALRLGCRGDSIDAAEAQRIGLVHEIVADLELGHERARAISASIARRSPTSIAAFKRAMLEGRGRPEGDRLSLEADAYDRCVDSGDAAIGRANFEPIRSGATPGWHPRRS